MHVSLCSRQSSLFSSSSTSVARQQGRGQNIYAFLTRCIIIEIVVGELILRAYFFKSICTYRAGVGEERNAHMFIRINNFIATHLNDASVLPALPKSEAELCKFKTRVHILQCNACIKSGPDLSSGAVIKKVIRCWWNVHHFMIVL